MQGLGLFFVQETGPEGDFSFRRFCFAPNCGPFSALLWPRFGTLYAICLYLRYEPKLFDLPCVLRPGGDEIDPRRLYAGMPQDIRQLHHVPAGPVEGPGEEMPQIVGKHLAPLHPGPAAEGFHLCPNLAPAQPPTASGEKDFTGGDFLFPGVFQKLAAELPRQQDGPELALEGDGSLSCPGSLYGDVPHLRHPDASGADGLDEEGQAVPAQGLGGFHQAGVVFSGQVSGGAAEHSALDAEVLDLAVGPAQKCEEAVES